MRVHNFVYVLVFLFFAMNPWAFPQDVDSIFANNCGCFSALFIRFLNVREDLDR